MARGQVSGGPNRFAGETVSSVYFTLSIVYVLSYKWQDMIKIFGVKVPPCADLLARQAAHCGKISPSVHRVHLHKMSAM